MRAIGVVTTPPGAFQVLADLPQRVLLLTETGTLCYKGDASNEVFVLGRDGVSKWTPAMQTRFIIAPAGTIYTITQQEQM